MISLPGNRLNHFLNMQLGAVCVVVICLGPTSQHAYGGYSSTILNDNPVAYWRLGEAANTVPASDEITPEVFGSYTSGVTVGHPGTFAVDDGNTAVGFDNSSNVQFPDDDKLDFGTGDFSIEVWAKTPDTNQPDRIIAKDDGAGWQIRIESRDDREDTNKALFFIRGSGGEETSIISTSDVNDDQWHHIVAVRESSMLSLYVDGVPEVTGVESLHNADSANDLFIGTFNGAAGNAAFEGLIDEVALYNHALSEASIAMHLSPGEPLTPGDVTGEGDVNLADFEVIRQNFLLSVTMRNEGDLIRDGIVNFADFREWKNNRDAGVLIPSLTLPEPGGLFLWVVGLGALSLCGRRSQRGQKVDS